MNAITRTDVPRQGGTFKLPVQPHVPALDRWRDVMNNPARDGGGVPDYTRSELVPLEAHDDIRRDVALLLEPAEPKTLVAFATALLMAYPQQAREDMAFWIAGCAEDLAEYPPAVVVEAMRGLRKTKKFVPAIAEIREACEAELVVAKAPLRVLNAHKREHENRVREAARQRDIQARRDARAADLVKLFGPGAPTPEEVDHTAVAINFCRVCGNGGGSNYRHASWSLALKAGELWARTVITEVMAWSGGSLAKNAPAEVAEKIVALWPTETTVACETAEDALRVSA